MNRFKEIANSYRMLTEQGKMDKDIVKEVLNNG